MRVFVDSSDDAPPYIRSAIANAIILYCLDLVTSFWGIIDIPEGHLIYVQMSPCFSITAAVSSSLQPASLISPSFHWSIPFPSVMTRHHIFGFTSSNSAFSFSISVACIGQPMPRPSVSFGLGIYRGIVSIPALCAYFINGFSQWKFFPVVGRREFTSSRIERGSWEEGKERGRGRMERRRTRGMAG